MSPRRTLIQETLISRRPRRGSPGSTLPPRLALLVAPPAAFINGQAMAGASVRLLNGDGTIQALAGVPVTIALIGSATFAVSPGQTVLTDAQGVATWTALTLTGLASTTYTLQWTAAGYSTVQASGLHIDPGPPNAAKTTAFVPSGTVGQGTGINIIVRDASGNQLTQPAGQTVRVTVGGANVRAIADASYGGGGIYTYGYIPTVAGTDTISIVLGGAPIGGSPYTSIVSGVISGGFVEGRSMYVGLYSLLADLGLGPSVSGGVHQAIEPLWRYNQDSYTLSGLQAAIATADNAKILLTVPCAGSRTGWAVSSGGCLNFSRTLYEQKVAIYAGDPTVLDALKRRRLIWYGVDEPWLGSFCKSISPADVQWMHRIIKQYYPDSLTLSRIEPQFMINGWASNTQGTFAPPANYYDKLDYNMVTYSGRPKTYPTTGMTPSQWFNYAKGINTQYGYGTIYSINHVNLGDKRCWDADNSGDGIKDQRIFGAESTDPRQAQIVACSLASTEPRWYMSIEELDEVINSPSIMQDPDVPGMVSYTHWRIPFLLGNALIKGLEQRADYIAAFQRLIQAGENRPVFNGWRDAK